MYHLSPSYDYETAISYIGCVNAARLFIENYYTRGAATCTPKELVNVRNNLGTTFLNNSNLSLSIFSTRMKTIYSPNIGCLFSNNS